MELGNLLFNENKVQEYECPYWIGALLEVINAQLCRVMWNIEQEEYSSPFSNTGNKFKNDVFEVEAYAWGDEANQQYNFKWKDVEISWYKYLGRDTTINGIYKDKYIIQMFNECIESIFKMEE